MNATRSFLNGQGLINFVKGKKNIQKQFLLDQKLFFIFLYQEKKKYHPSDVSGHIKFLFVSKVSLSV